MNVQAAEVESAIVRYRQYFVLSMTAKTSCVVSWQSGLARHVSWD